jgi:hypothetical protein
VKLASGGRSVLKSNHYNKTKNLFNHPVLKAANRLVGHFSNRNLRIKLIMRPFCDSVILACRGGW